MNGGTGHVTLLITDLQLLLGTADVAVVESLGHLLLCTAVGSDFLSKHGKPAQFRQQIVQWQGPRWVLRGGCNVNVAAEMHKAIWDPKLTSVSA